MADEPGFQALQRTFTEHIRDPDNVPPPEGVEARRIGIYRRLFFNSLSSLLAKTFPVVRRLHDDGQWNALVRGFLRDHRSQTPLFLKIPSEFVDYLASRQGDAATGAPWLLELAHYEWQQLALSISTLSDHTSPLDESDLSAAPLTVSALSVLLIYRFPVHRISPNNRPTEPSDEPHFLLLHRDGDERVKHIELNRVSARLLELLRTADPAISGREACSQVASEIGQPSASVVIEAGLATLADLARRGIVIVSEDSQTTMRSGDPTDDKDAEHRG
ncbi:MAG: putative DNA-binding domain-containing protein [Pseudomonadota bacterium]